MLDQLRPKINHFFARLDASEIVPHARPISRFVAPAIAAGIASTQLAIDLKNAPDQPTRKKVLIRDLLVMGGIIAGLAVTGRLLTLKYGVANHLHLPGIAHDHGEKAVKVAEKVLKSAKERVTSLFKSPKCDHAGEGVVRLQSMAFGGIAGGGLGGVLADWFNGEDVKKTSAFKLKEGLFQYIGNITFCTLSILYLGRWGRKVAEKHGEKLLKVAGEKLEAFAGKTKTLLTSLEKEEVGNLKTIPGAASESFETYWLMAQKNVSHLKHELEHLGHHAKDNPQGLTRLIENFDMSKAGKAGKAGKVGRTGHESTDSFLQGIQRYLGDEFGDTLAGKGGTALIKEINTELLPQLGRLFTEGNKAEATRVFQKFYSRHLLNDLNTVTKNKSQIIDVAQERLALGGERVGIIAGLFTGVIGGAFASNAVNRVLTDTLNLPEGHEINGLFSGHHQSGGWMEGTVGERGIHWWDAILHLDDVPTALYIAGVHSVEAFINVLYGISGLLTGMAGTDYKTPQPKNNFKFEGNSPDHSSQPYQPVRRDHRAYSRFIH